MKFFNSKRWGLTTLITSVIIAGLLLIPAISQPATVGAITHVQAVVRYLNDLLDVNVPTPTDNYIVYWNNTSGYWEARAENVTAPFTCGDLDDCTISALHGVTVTPTSKWIIFYNISTSEWESQALSNWDLAELGTKEIDNLDDVNAPAPNDGDILFWNNTASEWQPKAESGGAFNCSDLDTCSLDDLGDVYTPAPGDQYFLYWDNASSNWTSRIILATDIPNLDTSKITTGTFTMPRLPSEVKTVNIIYIIEGANTTITTGEKGHLEVSFNCTIQQVTMVADQTGSIVVDIWKDTYANFPPTNADTITSITPPTITTALKSQDATLTNWTTSITVGDILAYNIDSCTNITKVTISLTAVKV